MQESFDQTHAESARSKVVLCDPSVREFIQATNIRAEDIGLITELARFSKEEIVLYLHNVLSTHKERSGQVLGRLMQTAQNDRTRKLYEAALAFVQKYDWAASWHLVRTLENINS